MVTIRRGGFEWDVAKRAFNLAKHGLDFMDAGEFDLAEAVHEEQDVGGERRTLSIGLLSERVCAMVWTWRGDRIRVISLRKANARETKRYVEASGSDS